MLLSITDTMPAVTRVDAIIPTSVMVTIVTTKPAPGIERLQQPVDAPEERPAHPERDGHRSRDHESAQKIRNQLSHVRRMRVRGDWRQRIDFAPH